jgi:hypothetical protein
MAFMPLSFTQKYIGQLYVASFAFTYLIEMLKNSSLSEVHLNELVLMVNPTNKNSIWRKQCFQIDNKEVNA